MDTKHILYLLDILSQRTSGRDMELARLYNNALNDNDDINRLKNALREHSFYGEIGNSIKDNGEQIIQRISSNPHNALEVLPQVVQAYERIENEAQVCMNLMHSPFSFNNTITILKSKDISAYRKSLYTIANVCVYLMVLYSGLDSIQELYWSNSGHLQEMIETVNMKYLPALCKVSRPSYSWIIRKHCLGGKALFGGDSFVLSYESIKSVNVLCSALHKEPIGTHAYLNIKAYESNENDVPYCWGVGNILSVKPDQAFEYFTHNAVTKLRSPRQSELFHRLPSPNKLLERLSNNEPFCITPDELVLAMNQWETGYEIEKRKRTHNCLFCGKYIKDGKLVCPSHFQTELK